LFALHADPLLFFLASFCARKWFDVFGVGERESCRTPVVVLCRASQGWLAGAAAALAWPACQTATGEGIVNIVD